MKHFVEILAAAETALDGNRVNAPVRMLSHKPLGILRSKIIEPRAEFTVLALLQLGFKQVALHFHLAGNNGKRQVRLAITASQYPRLCRFGNALARCIRQRQVAFGRCGGGRRFCIFAAFCLAHEPCRVRLHAFLGFLDTLGIQTDTVTVETARAIIDKAKEENGEGN